VRFGVLKGQSLGTNPGNLPPGYAPLSPAQVKQAVAAADKIERGISPLAKPDEGSAPQPSESPTPTPSQIVAAGVTPKDPEPLLANTAAPVAGGIFICSSMFYILLRRRTSRV